MQSSRLLIALSASLALLAACSNTPEELVENKTQSSQKEIEMTDQNASIYTCGEKTVCVVFHEDAADLSLDGKTYKLTQTVAASGVRYEGEGVLFHTKGPVAVLETGDGGYLKCQLVPTGEANTAPDITGKEWRVEDINNGGVIDYFHATLNFDGGKISGSTGCNRYAGPYTITGDQLSVGPLMTTRKACAPAIMDLERKFTTLMSGPLTIEVDDTGALVLSGPAGTLLAR